MMMRHLQDRSQSNVRHWLKKVLARGDPARGDDAETAFGSLGPLKQLWEGEWIVFRGCGKCDGVQLSSANK